MFHTVYKSLQGYEPALVFDIGKNLVYRDSSNSKPHCIPGSVCKLDYLEKNIYQLAFSNTLTDYFGFLDEMKKVKRFGLENSRALISAYPGDKIRLFLSRFVESETHFNVEDLDLVISCFQRLGDLSEFERELLKNGLVEYDIFGTTLIVSGFSTVVYIPKNGTPITIRSAPYVELTLDEISKMSCTQFASIVTDHIERRLQ